MRRMNTQAVFAANSGMIILGGGVVKHHICNANLMVRLSPTYDVSAYQWIARNNKL